MEMIRAELYGPIFYNSVSRVSLLAELCFCLSLASYWIKNKHLSKTVFSFSGSFVKESDKGHAGKLGKGVLAALEQGEMGLNKKERCG